MDVLHFSLIEVTLFVNSIIEYLSQIVHKSNTQNREFEMTHHLSLQEALMFELSDIRRALLVKLRVPKILDCLGKATLNITLVSHAVARSVKSAIEPVR